MCEESEEQGPRSPCFRLPRVVIDGPPEPTDSRTNLPAARVTLYGRVAEIERLAGEVLSAPGRLVTITGPGGVGKTSVALAVARQVLTGPPSRCVARRSVHADDVARGAASRRARGGRT